MKKQNYSAPEMNLISLYIEEALAASSVYQTIHVTTEANDVRLSGYETLDESTKDFNINF